MTKVAHVLRFLVSAKLWLNAIKAFLIAFVLVLIAMQIPELMYDALWNEPVVIDSPEDLDPQLLEGSSYARIEGSPTFEYAFIYERYGLRYIYFTLEGYDRQVLARAYGQDVNLEEWRQKTSVSGKLRPFEGQPFSYNIEEIFEDENGVAVPEEAYYLGVGDIPAINAWQVGSITFALILLGAMVYFFYFFKRDKQQKFFSDPLDYLNKDSA